MTRAELLALTKLERKALPRFRYELSDNCIYCIGCTDCYHCTDCRDCADCYDCYHCTDCIGIQNGKNLRYVAYGIQLTKEEWERLSLLQ